MRHGLVWIIDRNPRNPFDIFLCDDIVSRTNDKKKKIVRGEKSILTLLEVERGKTDQRSLLKMTVSMSNKKSAMIIKTGFLRSILSN